MSIFTRIEELRLSESTDAKVKAWLTIDGYSAKDIAAAFKELGGAKAAKGFAAQYYEWLAEEVRTKAQATDYVNGDGGYDETTNNVKKHMSHYLNIWELSSNIWGAKGDSAEEAQAEPEPEAEPEVNDGYQKAWDKAQTAKEKYERGGRKPSRNAYHPDKVAKYEDQAITDLYTELFKMFT